MSTSLPPVDTPPDTDLIARFQADESDVFDLLYRRHGDRIHDVILYVVSNPDDALDITQEVFLKAYQKLPGFKRASQFYSWLYRIAINQCIDFMRRQSARHVLSHEPYVDDEFFTRYVHPCVALEREEFHRRLHDVLPALTPCQRTVFVLRYKEELSLKAIARRLGRSTGTVKAHLFHAHRTLHRQLLPYFRFAL